MYAASAYLQREFFRPVSTSEMFMPAWDAAIALARQSGVALDAISPLSFGDNDRANARSFDAAFQQLSAAAVALAKAAGLSIAGPP